MSLLQFAIRFC